MDDRLRSEEGPCITSMYTNKIVFLSANQDKMTYLEFSLVRKQSHNLFDLDINENLYINKYN